MYPNLDWEEYSTGTRMKMRTIGIHRTAERTASLVRDYLQELPDEYHERDATLDADLEPEELLTTRPDAGVVSDYHWEIQELASRGEQLKQMVQEAELPIRERNQQVLAEVHEQITDVYTQLNDVDGTDPDNIYSTMEKTLDGLEQMNKRCTVPEYEDDFSDL